MERHRQRPDIIGHPIPQPSIHHPWWTQTFLIQSYHALHHQHLWEKRVAWQTLKRWSKSWKSCQCLYRNYGQSIWAQFQHWELWGQKTLSLKLCISKSPKLRVLLYRKRVRSWVFNLGRFCDCWSLKLHWKGIPLTLWKTSIIKFNKKSFWKPRGNQSILQPVNCSKRAILASHWQDSFLIF